MAEPLITQVRRLFTPNRTLEDVIRDAIKIGPDAFFLLDQVDNRKNVWNETSYISRLADYPKADSATWFANGLGGALYRAIHDNDQRFLKKLHERDLYYVAVYACNQHQLEQFKQIILPKFYEAGISLNVHATPLSPTPLHRAIQKGNIPLIEFLLDAGTDVNLPSVLGNKTPLQYAITSEHLSEDKKCEVVSTLLNKGSIDLLVHGDPVLKATLDRNQQLAELLIKKGFPAPSSDLVEQRQRRREERQIQQDRNRLILKATDARNAIIRTAARYLKINSERKFLAIVYGLGAFALAPLFTSGIAAVAVGAGVASLIYVGLSIPVLLFVDSLLRRASLFKKAGLDMINDFRRGSITAEQRYDERLKAVRDGKNRIFQEWTQVSNDQYLAALLQTRVNGAITPEFIQGTINEAMLEGKTTTYQAALWQQRQVARICSPANGKSPAEIIDSLSNKNPEDVLEKIRSKSHKYPRLPS